MENQEHLDILKQGVEVWNRWRHDHPDVKPDLVSAHLIGLNLVGINLSHSTLLGVNFNMANLQNAELSGSSLRGASFMATNLRGANLSRVNLWDAQFGNSSVGAADCSGTDFSHSELGGVDLSNVNLSRANFSGAEVGGAILTNANLNGADFTGAIFAGTALGDRDLRVVKGLETVQHRFRSPLSINTIYLSSGSIPEAFLKGTGAPNAFIDYMRLLASRHIEYYSCFISFSSKDKAFAERLYTDLQNNGVSCWFALEDMRIGDRIRDRIDESIRDRDKLLVVLSEHSVNSAWVEDEVEAALEKERISREHGEKQTVLFPIQLDDAVMDVTAGWPAKIRRTRVIGDFKNWDKSHTDYIKAFKRLLRDLKPEV